MTKRPPLVIYHANCADGFTAAWVAYKFLLADAEYWAMRYDELTPTVADVQGRDVYVLDFSFNRAACVDINELATKLVILDHHKTAEAELEGLDFAQFDMARSGAMMAWDYFSARAVSNDPEFDTLPPWLVSYVQDRDLWNHTLSRTKEVNAYIATQPYTFMAWNLMMNRGVEAAISAGKGALAYVQMLVRKAEETHLAPCPPWYVFDGYEGIPVINTTAAVSDVVGALAECRPFAIGWWQNSNGSIGVSLRSRGESGVDVSEIAKKHGGGGHKNAAGFTTVLAKLPWLRTEITHQE